MAYIEPKTNWNESYEPGTQDMNRIEGNIKEIKDVEIARVDSDIASEIDAIEARTITAGDGLSGGGTLAENRTINVDSTVFRYRGYTAPSETILSSSDFTLPAVSVGEIRRYQVKNTSVDDIVIFLPAGTLFLAGIGTGATARFYASGEFIEVIGSGQTRTFYYWRLV